MKKKGIYAIYDLKAEDIIGILQVHGHEAVAIRTFKDIATAERSMVQTHPEDYNLIQLGFLDSGDSSNMPHIIPAYQLVITGAALMAALNKPQQPELL